MIELNAFSVAAAQGHHLKIGDDEHGMPTIQSASQTFKEKVLTALSYVPILKNLQAVAEYSKQLKTDNAQTMGVFLHALSQKFGDKLTERTLDRLKVDLSGNTPLDHRLVTQTINDARSMYGPYRAMTMNASTLTGFHNLGNTCYANAALKLLIHSVGEERLIQQLEHIKKTSIDSPKKDAAEKFSAVIEASLTKQRPLRNELEELFSSLQKLETFSHRDEKGHLSFPIVGKQNDAQEFLVKVLAAFDLSDMAGYSMMLKETLAYQDEQRAPKGTLAYCHDTSVSNPAFTLQQIVDTTHQEEPLEVRWKSDDRENVTATKTKQWTAPDLSTLERFTLHINASSYDQNTGELGKTEFTNANFSDDVSLVVYDEKTQEKWAVTFEPREVIVQRGSGESGHYLAYTKTDEKEWVCHDDINVHNCHAIRDKDQAKFISFAVKDKVLLPRKAQITHALTANDASSQYATVAAA